ncbi:hypothetical protein GE09DRAFT_1065469 [Coniochaeta sp. 2T2.1]|nr:hypothetical protein GE09DRAFT_1065469 [Coniochaeta sp. 2T2.1]
MHLHLQVLQRSQDEGTYYNSTSTTYRTEQNIIPNQANNSMGIPYSIFSRAKDEALLESPSTTVIQDKREEPRVGGEMADTPRAMEQVSLAAAASESKSTTATATCSLSSGIVPPCCEFTFRFPIPIPQVNHETGGGTQATIVPGPALAGPDELSRVGAGREVAELLEMDILDWASRASLGRREMGSIDAVVRADAVLGIDGPESAEKPSETNPVGEVAELEASIFDVDSRSSAAVHHQFAGIDEMIVEAIQGWGSSDEEGEDGDRDVWYDAEDGSSCEEDTDASSQTSDDTWSCSFNSSLESLDIADQRFQPAGTVNGEDGGGFVLGPDDDETREVNAGDGSTYEADTEDKVSSLTCRSSVGYTSQLPHWVTVIPDHPFSPTSDIADASSAQSGGTTSSESIIARTNRQYRLLRQFPGDGSASTSTDTVISTSLSTAPSTAPSTSALVGASTDSSATPSSPSDPVSSPHSRPTSTTSLTPFPAFDTSHAVEQHVAFNPTVTRYSGRPGAVTPVATTSAAAPCPRANLCPEAKPNPPVQPRPDISLPHPPPLSLLSSTESPSPPPPSSSTSPPPSPPVSVRILTPPPSSVPTLTLTPPTPRVHPLTHEEKFRAEFPVHRYNHVANRTLLFVNENDRDMKSRQRRKARVQARWVVVKRRRDRFRDALRPVVGPKEAIRRAFDAARGWEGWCWE